MDWKEFFASLVGSLAWPAVVAYLAFLLKDKLAELLPKLKRFKHKDTELEFVQAVEELQKEVSEAQAEQPVPAEPDKELEEQYSFLARLSEISSRSAVLEAWRIVEGAAAKAIAKAYPELEGRGVLSPLHMQKMLQGKVLSKSEWRQFDELRRLRNTAAHAEEFDLKGMPIEAYLDIALTMARRIERYEP